MNAVVVCGACPRNPSPLHLPFPVASSHPLFLRWSSAGHADPQVRLIIDNANTSVHTVVTLRPKNVTFSASLFAVQNVEDLLSLSAPYNPPHFPSIHPSSPPSDKRYLQTTVVTI